MSRRARILLLGTAILAGLLVVLAGAFPISWFRGSVERTIAGRFDTPVRIGALEREGLFSFAPVVEVRDIHIAQPQWAGHQRWRVQAGLLVRQWFTRIGPSIASTTSRTDAVR